MNPVLPFTRLLLRTSPAENGPFRSSVAAILLFVILVIALVLPAAGCGEEEAGDPDAILAQASAAMKQIAGFHFVYEVHKPSSAEPSSGLEIARVTGDVNSEGSMQAVIDVTQGGIPLQLEFVVVGDTQYIKDPLSQKWTAIAIEDSPVGDLNLGAGTIRILDQMTETSYEGREGKQGTETHHITGMVAAEDVEAIAGAVNTTEPFPTDIWVGVEDSFVYEVEIVGAATPSEDPEIRRTIVLSNLDEYVEIKAPL
jgi:lipoprotein LprG